MLFPTPTFAIFFAGVLPLSWLLMRRARSWRVFMLGASYVFYGCWDWHFVFLLAGSTVANQAAACAIARAESPGARKLLLVAGVSCNLAVLGYFKYADFFVTSAHNLLERAGIAIPAPIASTALPVGVSFFTFHAVSYLVDTYRGEIEPTTLPKFAVYLSFFPHLVAGPIVRPGELVPQLHRRRDPRRVDTTRAFFLIAGGLFKKLVIANALATHLVDPVFAAPEAHSSLELLMATYGYAVQIYADFSGYTDIAIGIALLLGFRFPKNFDAPYTAVSLQDFWRRWHMTLSRWLRDYLYIPLGGSRGSRLSTYRNLLLTMVLGGLWHGAGWTFVVWGGLHGFGLAFERALGERRGRRREPSAAGLVWRRLLTFHVVCLGWIFFRADSLSAAAGVVAGLFSRWNAPSPLVTAGMLAAIVAGIGVQYVPRSLSELGMARFSRLRLPVQGALLGCTLALTAAMGPEGVAPFIYFRF